MAISYNGQTPLFQSEFLEEAENGGQNFKSVFLGNAIDMNGFNSDLFLITYKSGDINAIVKYGKEDEEYQSGATFLWRAAITGENEALFTLYKRAVESGCLVEKEAVIGFSSTKDDMEYEKYFNSDYYKNRPSLVQLYDSFKALNLSDEEEEKREAEHNAKCEAYDEEYLKKHGKLPKLANMVNCFHIFENLEEAEKLCSADGGIYEVVTYTTESHLAAIGEEKNYISQMLNKTL